jgi:GGDEF domain-containing protein
VFYSEAQGGSSSELDGVISTHRDFASMVRHELRRSERYCTFVSLMTLRLAKLAERLQKKFPADAVKTEEFIAHLWNVIRSSVRSTDVVSRVDRDRIGVLLAETSKEGAMTLAQRLSDTLSLFLDETGEQTSNVDVFIEIGSFPSPDRGTIEKMLQDFVN